MSAPEVYDPGGLTIMVDDFCVKSNDLWHNVGAKLLQKLKLLANDKNVVQIFVVCGSHDKTKKDLIKNQDLSLASEWYVGSIND